MGIKPFDIRSIGRTGIINPDRIGYQDSLDIIGEELHRTRRSFVKIGWYLKHIRDKEMYKEEDYANIYELAADKFNLSQPTATRFMNICQQFSIGHDSPELDEQYIDFNVSQLFEMLPMNQEEVKQITSDMTVAQIRDFKKKSKEKKGNENRDIPVQTNTCKEKELLEETVILQMESQEHLQPTEQWLPIKEDITYTEEELSAYGLPETILPEGSLLVAEGCGNKYHCSSCVMDGCNIRKQSRHCREAPLGSLSACKTVDVLDDIRWDFDLKNRCQFINDSLVHHILENGELSPCCKDCQETCDYRCVKSLKHIVTEETESEKVEETAQPEILKLKNNDQRKKWLRNYEEWGLWYRDENIDVNYYKYDFKDGSRLVVAEYPKRRNFYREQEKDEYFFHLLEKGREGYGGIQYDEKYQNTPDSETYLVEFLKKIQKIEKDENPAI